MRWAVFVRCAAMESSIRAPGRRDLGLPYPCADAPRRATRHRYRPGESVPTASTMVRRLPRGNAPKAQERPDPVPCPRVPRRNASYRFRAHRISIPTGVDPLSMRSNAARNTSSSRARPTIGRRTATGSSACLDHHDTPAFALANPVAGELRLAKASVAGAVSAGDALGAAATCLSDDKSCNRRRQKPVTLHSRLIASIGLRETYLEPARRRRGWRR